MNLWNEWEFCHWSVKRNYDDVDSCKGLTMIVDERCKGVEKSGNGVGGVDDVDDWQGFWENNRKKKVPHETQMFLFVVVFLNDLDATYDITSKSNNNRFPLLYFRQIGSRFLNEVVFWEMNLGFLTAKIQTYPVSKSFYLRKI